MNIIHVLEDYSLTSGGIRTVVKNLHEELIKHNHKSIIISPFDEVNDNILKPKRADSFLWKYWGKTKNLDEILNEINQKQGKIDVIHVHGVWMHSQYLACRFSHINNIPYVVSFHGMFEPWLWKKGYIKKKLYFELFTKKYFKKANTLHSITPFESSDLKERFPNTKVYEIPNLIHDFKKNDKNEDIIKSSKKYILYLGRLDRKKGINLLIHAFSKIEDNNISLKIAGALNDYSKSLVKLVNSLNLNNRIEFLGLVKGKEKDDLFRFAKVFVAPSYSEVIGMVNLESAILGTPVITTNQTGISENWNKNGGILINPNVKEITNALNKVLSWSEVERKKNGESLKTFVREEYCWESKFKDWETLYNSI